MSALWPIAPNNPSGVPVSNELSAWLNTHALMSTVELSSGDIAALDTVPFELVAAPGVGKAVVPSVVEFLYLSGSIIYDTGVGSASAQISWEPLGNINIEPDANLQELLQNETDQLIIINSPLGTNARALADLEDQAVSLASPATFNTVGSILTSSLANGGADYGANDTGVVSGGDTGAKYKIDTVDGGGAVLTYHLTTTGIGHTVGNGVATTTGGLQPGAGTGFTIDVVSVSISPGDGTLQVTTFYSLLNVS